MPPNPFDFSIEDRGFERVEDDDGFFFSGGETEDATGGEFEEQFKVRGSRGNFITQRLLVDDSGKIEDKQTIGRGKQTRDAAEESLERTVENRTAATFGGFQIGDFVARSESDITMARAAHQGRSDAAVRQDERKRAAITTDASKYAKAPGEFDYPGVDTPSAEPDLLPKDFKRGGKPRTADFDDEQQQDDTRPAAGLAVQEGPSTDREQTRSVMGELQDRDVSASPDELFGGVGVVSGRELGGNVLGEGERSPPQLDEPPERSVRRQSRLQSSGFRAGETAGDDIAFIYNSEGVSMSLDEFRRRVKRKKRQMSGAADDFTAAQLVVEDIRSGGSNNGQASLSAFERASNRS